MAGIGSTPADALIEVELSILIRVRSVALHGILAHAHVKLLIAVALEVADLLDRLATWEEARPRIGLPCLPSFGRQLLLLSSSCCCCCCVRRLLLLLQSQPSGGRRWQIKLVLLVVIRLLLLSLLLLPSSSPPPHHVEKRRQTS